MFFVGFLLNDGRLTVVKSRIVVIFKVIVSLLNGLVEEDVWKIGFAMRSSFILAKQKKVVILTN
jgi:hypothetical protein